MAQDDPISAGQIYQGIASRYIFPPDSRDWWNSIGSYELHLSKAGRVWFTYQGYTVSPEGVRTATNIRRARLDDLRHELALGVVQLKPHGSREITREPID